MTDEFANRGGMLPRDDRQIVVDQDPSTKRWRVKREDARYEEGGKIVAADLASREVAGEWAEREHTLTPRTDSTRRARTRRTFYGFNIRPGLFHTGD